MKLQLAPPFVGALAALLLCPSAPAQDSVDVPIGPPASAWAERPAAPTARWAAAGGGAPAAPAAAPLGDLERRQIWSRIEESRERLTILGMLSPPPAPPTTVQGALDSMVLLGWPLRAVGEAAKDSDIHALPYLVDSDPAPGQALDFGCGSRTVDGYKALYFAPWPLGWNRVIAGEIEVVAAAPGTIVLRQDGWADQGCPGTSQLYWNAVYVQHDDGSVAWYGRLAKDSVTPKPVGARVAYGEFLGRMGSSGNSSAPHLYFALTDSDGQPLNPDVGACAPPSLRPRWIEPRAYDDAAVNRVQVGLAKYASSPCPQPDLANDELAVPAGGLVYFTTFFHSLGANQTSTYRIRRPDGSVWEEWQYASTAAFAWANWRWWSWFLPAGPTGTWSFEVEFEGNLHETEFGVY